MSFARSIIVTIAFTAGIAACSSSAPSASSALPASLAAASQPASASLPIPSPVPSPTAAAPSPSAAPSATVAPSLTPDEVALARSLRVDAASGCVPRRTDLPPRATLGVECHPADSLVAAVGIYSFAPGTDPEPARDTYLERMAAAGVKPATGDCHAGTPGDRAWPTTVDDKGDDGGLLPTRSGCFLDENGIANIRLTCYGDLYIGVLGNTKELAALYAWASKVAPGESVDRDPPGICAAPD
jgi:hypothetical protein